MSSQSHISLILDRTGSMDPIRDDVIGGFNTFLAEQQALPDPATFTLVQFDSQDPYEVLQRAAPIDQVRPLTRNTYVPRGCTPLYDAIGNGILDLETALAAMPDAARPARIAFVIVTDGHENASREFNRQRVMRLIEAKKQLDWQFVFLSADVTAFNDAGTLGVDDDARLYFDLSKKGNDAMWNSVSDKLGEFRSLRSSKVAFDKRDRQQQATRKQGRGFDPARSQVILGRCELSADCSPRRIRGSGSRA